MAKLKVTTKRRVRKTGGNRVKCNMCGGKGYYTKKN